jgi:hypothetical protein
MPVVVAAHQLALGTSDPTTVGRWLRLSSFLVFIAFALTTLRFFRTYLPVGEALLGAVMSLSGLYAWFLSDTTFPEVWFTIALLLFLIYARERVGRRSAVAAYVWAVAAYAFRTVGLAAFVVWVLDSVIRRRFKEAALRLFLVLIPIVAWQSYVASVERSDNYKHPAYAYQRAPYMFYNVSYARNVALRDPTTPEKGDVRIVRRILRDGSELPASVGETLTASRKYFEQSLSWLIGEGARRYAVIEWTVFIGLSLFGGVLLAGGIVVQVIKGEWIVPLCVVVYLGALVLTPFPSQYVRYLMPLAAPLVLSAIVFLRAIETPRTERARTLAGTMRTLCFLVLGPALLIQLLVMVFVYLFDFPPVSYVDTKGERVQYRLFLYEESGKEFDEAVDYLQAKAEPQHIVAAGTPHWIYLRTGLKTVMTPFEHDPAKEQALLESVPVEYLIVGHDAIASERYTLPLLQLFPTRWERVYTSGGRRWEVYRRTAR